MAITQQFYDVFQFFQITTVFFYQLVIFFKLVGIKDIKHRETALSQKQNEKDRLNFYLLLLAVFQH